MLNLIVMARKVVSCYGERCRTGLSWRGMLQMVVMERDVELRCHGQECYGLSLVVV